MTYSVCRWRRIDNNLIAKMCWLSGRTRLVLYGKSWYRNNYVHHAAVWKMCAGNCINESCNGEGSYPFIPTAVFIASQKEVYIIGNGLLFRYILSLESYPSISETLQWLIIDWLKVTWPEIHIILTSWILIDAYFSPNRGSTIYSLEAPWTILEITSFVVSSDNEVYALVWRRANQVCAQ